MKIDFKIVTLFSSMMLFSSCDVWDQLEAKAKKVNNYERAALTLSKENRDLRMKISQMQFEIQTLKSEKEYLDIQLKKSKSAQMAATSGKGVVAATPDRAIASIAPVENENDLVKFDVYKWTPSQILAVAEKEFSGQNYEKSAQFFKTFYDKFPDHKQINDQFLFQAGVAAYESNGHHDWTLSYLNELVKNYPTSKYYRGAKLWMALTHLKLGENDKFFSTVEEFRKKYRNTEEWKVLSQHYEKIVHKYKK